MKKPACCTHCDKPLLDVKDKTEAGTTYGELCCDDAVRVTYVLTNGSTSDVSFCCNRCADEASLLETWEKCARASKIKDVMALGELCRRRLKDVLGEAMVPV